MTVNKKSVLAYIHMEIWCMMKVAFQISGEKMNYLLIVEVKWAIHLEQVKVNIPPHSASLNKF